MQKEKKGHHKGKIIYFLCTKLQKEEKVLSSHMHKLFFKGYKTHFELKIILKGIIKNKQFKIFKNATLF